jgi:selenocysteine lyase/cysteine desulfurase
LVASFRQHLSDIPDLRFHSPVQPDLATGLLTCTVPGWAAEALRQHLWETRRMLVAEIQEFNAMRFSVAFFNTEEELEMVAEALSEASRRKPAS